MGMCMISLELLKILENSPPALDGSGGGDLWIWGAGEGSVGSLLSQLPPFLADWMWWCFGLTRSLDC